MRILFITTAHNGLSQRASIELGELGHKVDIHITESEEKMIKIVDHHKPDLILAPFLKMAIPRSIWQNYTVFIVHPGIKGDRGPSSLDWAIMKEEKEWGVTVLQADEEMDAGDIWSSHNFQMRPISKSCLYRHEVTNSAMIAIHEAIQKFEKGVKPEPLNYDNSEIKGRLQASIKTKDRTIDWNSSSDEIIKRIRAADSNPGVLDQILGVDYRLFGAHKEGLLKGEAGELIAHRDGAICRATGDGAIWITHLKSKNGIKLPATEVLKEKTSDLTESKISPFDTYLGLETFQEIKFHQEKKVGFLSFDFYNGAMSKDQCIRLRDTILEIKKRDINVLVLLGGHDIWSNGIHLNIIENAENKAQESWENINAIDDLIYEIINLEDIYVVSAMQGNAGAGGVLLALAADTVYARKGIVLNPHYRNMGGLYGSEYWTYLLPKRVGFKKALELTESCLAIGTRYSTEICLIDDDFGLSLKEFTDIINQKAHSLSNSTDLSSLIKTKNEIRKRDEAFKPLKNYRDHELNLMKINFFGANDAYHKARHDFVYKKNA
ncbi:MAG: hydrogenase maturation protein [Bacteroidetes bacterium]|nr:hydrogenase maturation protein [Bacteroidota bacterium]